MPTTESSVSWPRRRGVSAPLLPARFAQGFCAHPPLWHAVESLPKQSPGAHNARRPGPRAAAFAADQRPLALYRCGKSIHSGAKVRDGHRTRTRGGCAHLLRHGELSVVLGLSDCSRYWFRNCWYGYIRIPFSQTFAGPSAMGNGRDCKTDAQTSHLSWLRRLPDF